MSSKYTKESLQARYNELVQKRDEINAQIVGKPQGVKKLFSGGSLQERLDAANAKVAEAQKEAQAIADQIQAIRGGAEWIELKKEIGVLARMLQKAR